ncbi:MAG TPA: right-handed parallel beta-helix repeat-containing protein, partial [Nitrososphaeraceae archaeon]|nr:right-handed parallel beta-helix repeat-containing protein [Nitrososphaeraceae archaeon]
LYMRGNFRGEVLRKNCPLSAYSMVLATVILLVVSAAQIANGGNYIAHSHPKPLLAENTFSGDLAKHVSLFPNINNSNASLPSFPPALPTVESNEGPCVFYDLPSRTINVCGGVVSLDTINKILRDPSILNNTADKIWFLNANISVLDGATLTISANDTKWLKINSTLRTDAYSIISHGNLIINDTKISSWNLTSNQEAALRNFNTPRSYIASPSGASGQMNITNSNLTNLGFNGGQGAWGVSYYSGDGSIIQNNNLSLNFRPLYFGKNASNILVSGNTINDNRQNGITIYKSSNINISGNEIRNNGLRGITCLFQCNTIAAKNNVIHNNARDGIRFDMNTINSLLQYNQIYDNKQSGITIRNSSFNSITSNTLNNNRVGIALAQNSFENSLNNNTVRNSSLYGIYLQSNSSSNKVEKNVLQSSQNGGIALNDGKYNTFSKNMITNNSDFGIRFRNASGNIIVDNTVLNNPPHNIYFASSSVFNIFRNTIFDNSSVRFFDNSSNAYIENTDNMLTANNKEIPTSVYTTNSTLLLIPATSKNILVDTLDMSVIPSKNYLYVSSFSNDFEINTNYKKWIETSTDPEIESKYIVGGFKPNTQIAIDVNGTFWNAYTSNDTGHITFLYDKGSRQNGLTAEFEAYPSNRASISALVLLGVIVAVSVGLLLVRRSLKKITVPK